jgi:molybdate transport system regulatory protein
VDTELIGKSWDQLANKQQDVIASFYQRCLEIYPEYKELFYQPADELEHAMKKMVKTIALLARVASETEVLHPHMTKLGHKYRHYNLSKNDLLKFKDVFLQVLKEFCDENCVIVWDEAFEQHVIPYMVQGLELSMPDHLKRRLVDLQTSTRNQFLGTVTTIKKTSLLAEVILTLRGNDQLVAMLTPEGVARLNLVEGGEVYAMIRAPQVMLMHADTDLKVSSRNSLCGKVVDVTGSVINARVLIELPGGSILQSLITRDAADELKIQIGERVCAFFHSKDVTLAVRASSLPSNN